eukprot:5809486-Pyramimonas_sp.AAC.1
MIATGALWPAARRFGSESRGGIKIDSPPAGPPAGAAAHATPGPSASSSDPPRPPQAPTSFDDPEGDPLEEEEPSSEVEEEEPLDEEADQAMYQIPPSAAAWNSHSVPDAKNAKRRSSISSGNAVVMQSSRKRGCTGISWPRRARSGKMN